MRATAVVLSLAVVVAAGDGFGQITRTWNGGNTTSDWFTAANWLPGGGENNYPQDGDTVVIPAGTSVLLSNSTASLAAFSITNATLAFTNWATALIATNVTIYANGTLRPVSRFLEAEMSNRVHIVATNLNIESNGRIFADVLGFGASGTTVSGPGAGSSSGNRGSGGSYGGRGGSGGAAAPAPCGSTNAPLDPGSTGGYGYSVTPGAGHGGGAIRIIAGTVNVNGEITANGGSSGTYGGGGSGGGIYITCDTFSGTGGVIRANGGTCSQSNSGAGGGGRIAVDCQSIVHPLGVVFSVRPGYTSGRVGGYGTLYFPNSAILTETLSQFDGVRLIIPGSTSWSVTNLTISTGTVVGLPFDIALTVASNLTVNSNAWLILGGDPVASRTATGTATRVDTSALTNPVVTVGKNVLLNGGVLTLGGNLHPVPALLTVGGELIVTNSGQLYVYAGVSNSVRRYGSTVAVGGTTTLAGTGSWILPYSHSTNGAAVLFDLANLVVETGSGFNADNKGYAWIGTTCYAPSYGGSSASRGAGSGHGGSGGNITGASGGGKFDSTNAPLRPGAPGGYGHSTGVAAPGGGAVRIHAASVTLDGVISANQTGGNGYGGGGGGGGIFITCDALAGAATSELRAKGGPGGTSGTPTGGGGGGRISVAIGLSDANIESLILGQAVEGMAEIPQPASYLGTTSVTNGLGNSGNPGTEGTVRFLTISAGHTVTVAGSPGEYGSPVPGYQNWIDIPHGSLFTNTVTTPDDENDGLRRACIGWTLAVTGNEPFYTNAFGTQAIIEVTNNLTITWLWTNEYELAVSTSAGGTATTSSNGWHTNGISVAGLTATPDAGYAFNQWVGIEAPVGEQTENPLTVVMDQPRRITAAFYSTVAGATRTWTGSGEWRHPGTNWNPIGRPGPLDSAVIAAGTSRMAQAEQVYALEVQAGATLAFTNWFSKLETTQDVTVRSNANVTVTGHFTPAQMSNRVWIVAGRDFVLEQGGAVNVDHKGFLSGTGEGAGGGYGSNFGGGGGHGGMGGANVNGAGAGTAYGSTNMPSTPGSGGHSYDGLAGHGGGVVRIEASRLARINGTVSANGNAGGQYNGGGAGGSILMFASSFEGSSSGSLCANGGNRGTAYTSLGGGGGGRIAVWVGVSETVRDAYIGGETNPVWMATTNKFYAGAFTADGASLSAHSLPDSRAPQPGTAFFFTPKPAAGSVFMIR